MYLEHFKLNSFPFTLTPNTDFYCELPTHEGVFNVLMVTVQSGEGFIKVIGEVGTGKTILCRRLLNELPGDYVTAYIPNPDLTPEGLRKALAHELDIEFDNDIDQHALLELIMAKLLEQHQNNKKVVLVIDEAQALSVECLEAVRLLTNLETESTKLLQVVLFAQPELEEMLNTHQLRQLRQRITFSCSLAPISQNDMRNYLAHRLVVAGHTYDNIFTPKARVLLYKASQGLPRLINVLCHKALLAAFGKGHQVVTKHDMLAAIKDTDLNYGAPKSHGWQKVVVALIMGAVAVGVAWKWQVIKGLV